MSTPNDSGSCSSSIGLDSFLQSLDNSKLEEINNVFEESEDTKTSKSKDYASSVEELAYTIDTQDSPEIYIARESMLYNHDTQSDFDSLDEKNNFINNNNEKNLEDKEDYSNEEEEEEFGDNDFVIMPKIELELDSLYIMLKKNSFTNLSNMLDSDMKIINNLTIYNEIKYVTSETFKKLKFKPVSIGYMYLLNYRTNILVWTKDSIYVLYNKILECIKNNLILKNKNSNNEDEIISDYNNLSRLPPFIDPKSKPVTISGERIVLLLFEALVNIYPTSLFIRGSKLPIINYYNNILKFNKLLMLLLNPILDNEENNDSLLENNQSNVNNKYSLKERIDWAYNFFESITVCFNNNDVTYLIQYIENYFLDTDNIFLEIKVKTNFTNHYFIDESNCFRGDIFYENNKIGQILMYYHNSLMYRNEIVGDGRISPLGLNINQAETLNKNSARVTVTNLYKTYKHSLKNGLIKRIEIREFQFNEISLKFPLILCNLVNNMSKRFNERMLNNFNMFICDNRSQRIIAPSSCLPVFFSNNFLNSTMNDKILLFNSFNHFNFLSKIKILTDMLEKSISIINFDLVIYIIMEEMLFIGYNGFRKTGLKYSFSKSLIEKLLKRIIDLDITNVNSSINVIRDLKSIFYEENKTKIKSYKIDSARINLNKIIDYSIINVNFMFKEVYSVENAYRILCIITQSKNTLLTSILNKFNEHMSTDVTADDETLIYKFTSKIIEFILIPQLFCEFFHFFSFSEKEKHEWVSVSIPVLSFASITCCFKKKLNTPQLEIIKAAIYDGKFSNCPNIHFIRQNNRKQRSKLVSISNYIDLLYSTLTDNSSLIQKNNEKPLFQSTKMILNIILFYTKKYSLTCNCKQMIQNKILKLYKKDNQIHYSNENDFMSNFKLYFPEIVEGGLHYLHNKGENGFMWVTLIPDDKMKKPNYANLSKIRLDIIQNQLMESSDLFFEEVSLINSLFSFVSLRSDFKYFIYLKSCKISKEMFRKTLIQNNCSLHLLNYWDIIESNRDILLSNGSSFFNIFLKKAIDYIFFTKSISKVISATSILYILYCSSILLCNNPAVFTKNYRKSSLINTFPFLSTNNVRQSPATIDKPKFISFCKDIDN